VPPPELAVLQVRNNHGGGYAYRLCPAASPLTESCFQAHHLDFIRDQQALVLNNGSVVPIPGTFVDEGTQPTGSTWAMIPLPPNVLGPRCVCSPNDRYQPANYSCGCLKGEEKIACTSPGNCSKGACLPCPGTPGSDCSRCSNGVGDSFEPPCGGCYGGSQPTVKDVVKVPANLPPGKYVLGFRYDCEATAQVWSNCADIHLAH